MLIFVVILMIVLNLLMGLGQPGTVDSTGHIGGGITGLFWGFAFFPRVNSSYGNKMRKAGLGLTLVWFLLFLILFYTTKRDTCS